MPAARATHPARRTDAGTVKLTDRDITGLTLCADQYGAPHYLLATALDVREERLRGILARWRHAGYARVSVMGHRRQTFALPKLSVGAVGLDLPDRLALLGLEHVLGPAGCPVARQG
jgi:hypothetical protein